jgi:UDP-N-acetylmuramoyl-tripeptide--D-alanyl-D-alanine ligase
MMARLSELARDLNAPLRGNDAAFSRVLTDTRQLQAGDLFVALRGERHDAHDFLAEARARGAVGALVSRAVDDPLAQVRSMTRCWACSSTHRPGARVSASRWSR